MVKDCADRHGVGEDGYEIETAVAAGAFQRIDVINPFEKRCPFKSGKS